jgi:lysozyme family protein
VGDFNIAMETVLKNEGGLGDVAGDEGGLTNFGLSQRSYPDLDLRNLTVEQARAVYFHDFWLFQGVNNQSVCTKLMDSYVNLRHTAIKLAQIVVNAEQDGVYGPTTERLINLEDAATFLQRYRNELVDHYLKIAEENPSQTKFLQGWLRRARQ